MAPTPPPPPVVRRTITLDAPLELVWDTLTAPDQIQAWLGLEVDRPLAPGVVGRHHDHGESRDVLIADIEPGSSLHWHWARPDGDGHDVTTVSITLDHDDETAQTTVTVTECAADHRSGSGVCARTAALAEVWDQRLTGLRSVIARRAFSEV